MAGLVGALAISGCPGIADAVPSFAVQTGQPCAACHVGAWGPQLKRTGREFKLFGYSASDQPHDLPPLALIVNGGFTRTGVDSPDSLGPHLGKNNNFDVENVSLYYAGRFNAHSGGFIELQYDGVARRLGAGEIDIRYARDFDLATGDIVLGATINDDPTVSDIFNATPVWGFPYLSSAIAPTPSAMPLIDRGLSQQVAGAGAYLMWNDQIYAEAALYKGLGRDVRNALGVVPVAASDSVDGVAPYWRLAVQRYWDVDHQFVAFGTFGIAASKYPGGETRAGTDRLTDIGIDASYQWVEDPARTVSDVVSGHASFVHEDLALTASHVLDGANTRDRLATAEADVSYAAGATVTPTVQYFRTWGSNDAAAWGNPNADPASSGWIAEVDLVPWGKPNSPLKWLNARLLLQYVAYARFNGASEHASDHNVAFVALSAALGLNR